MRIGCSNASDAQSVEMSTRFVPGPLKLLGTGVALPGTAVSTESLLQMIESRFGAKVIRRGMVLSRRLGIRSRHVCRDFGASIESARKGDTNPELASRALLQALSSGGLRPEDISFLVGHTTSPHTLLPPNV